MQPCCEASSFLIEPTQALFIPKGLLRAAQG